MAAPSATKWGSIAYGNGESSRGGRIGIYRSETKTSTTISGTIEIWFWSKYGVSDTGNTLYYDNLSASGSATTSRGTSNIQTSVSSGEGWSTSNQVKLKSYSYSYTRGTSASTRYLYAKLTNVDRVAATMTVSTTFSVPKLDSYTVSYDANGGSGAPSSQTKYYGKTLTLSNTKPTRSGYTFVGWGTSTTDTSADYAAGGSYTTNAGDTLYAIWKKTLTLAYNTNGGSTAPSTQSATIYNATTSYKFTIPTTKPTKTGHSFLGWSKTSSATSASYSAGGTITISANTTLYAVWKPNTYTVTYNANGGTGAPGAQTKTYGVTLRLSNTKPTKANYDFVGWGTTKTATAKQYDPGASYTANSAITLYAVWKLAYVKPRIEINSVSRCDKDGNISDSGTYACFDLAWECDKNISTAQVEFESSSNSFAENLPIDGTLSGIVDKAVLGGGKLSVEATYTVKITITDELGYTTEVVTLPAPKFIIDILAEGKGIAFNKPAESEGVMDIGFQTRLSGGIAYVLLPSETNLDDRHTPGFYMGKNVSTNNYVNCPLTSGTFTLEILAMGDNGQLMQRLTQCHISNPIVYERTYYESAGWGQWFGGWHDAVLSEYFELYPNSKVQYRKDGRVVEIRGIVTPTNGTIVAGGDTHYPIFTLPVGYRPSSTIYIVCQGSYTATWMLRVNTNGEVGFARYRQSGVTGWLDVDYGTWLPFQLTYLV